MFKMTFYNNCHRDGKTHGSWIHKYLWMRMINHLCLKCLTWSRILKYLGENINLHLIANISLSGSIVNIQLLWIFSSPFIIILRFSYKLFYEYLQYAIFFQIFTTFLLSKPPSTLHMKVEFFELLNLKNGCFIANQMIWFVILYHFLPLYHEIRFF
jgi:hypothetical protein